MLANQNWTGIYLALLVFVRVNEAVFFEGIENMPYGIALDGVLGCQGLKLQAMDFVVIQYANPVRNRHPLILIVLLVFSSRSLALRATL